MQKFLLLVIFTSTFSFSLNPTKKITQYFLDKWANERVIPFLSCYDLIQDPNGYIWIATEGGV